MFTWITLKTVLMTDWAKWPVIDSRIHAEPERTSCLYFTILVPPSLLARYPCKISTIIIALQFRVTSRGRGLCQLPDYSPSLSEVRAVTQGKKVEVEEEAEIRKSTGFLSMSGSDCFLLQPRTTCPSVVLPTVEWALPSHLLIKSMPNRNAYGSILWRHFLSWGFLFPEDPGSWQKKPNEHRTKIDEV